MGSIPLVALSSRPQVEAPDAVGAIGRAMQIRQLAGQNAMIPGQLQQQQQAIQQGQGNLQLQQGAITAQQQENQMRQLALQSQQGLRKTISEWDPTKDNIEDFPSKAAANGVLPQDIKPFIDQQMALTKNSSDNLDFMKKKQGLVTDGITAALSAPDEQLAETAAGKLNELGQIGALDSGHVQQGMQIVQQFQNDPAGLRQHLQQYEKENGIYSQMLDTAQKQAALNKTVSEQFKEIPGTGIFYNPSTGETKTAEGGATMSPQMMESKYVQINTAKELGQPVSKADQAFADSYKGFKELVPTATFNLNQGAFVNQPQIKPGATGQAALSQMDPKMASLVKMVGDYQQKSSDVTNRMPPAVKANFLSALNAAYPNYNEREYDARSKMVNSYTSGPDSKPIGAINTAMGHVGVMYDAIDGLNNGDLRGLNAIANRFGLETGSTPVAVFKTIVHRLGPELAAAYIQGGGGEGERGTTAADFDPNLPPQTLKANATVTAQLLRSKIGSLENNWRTTMQPGTPDQQFNARFITPEAQATLDKLSPKGGAQGGGSSGGSAPSAPAGKSAVFDPSGTPHFVDSDKLKQFLADPKYKGWHQ